MFSMQNIQTCIYFHVENINLCFYLEYIYYIYTLYMYIYILSCWEYTRKINGGGGGGGGGGVTIINPYVIMSNHSRSFFLQLY